MLSKNRSVLNRQELNVFNNMLLTCIDKTS